MSGSGSRLHVIGAGLIGGSAALAAAARGWTVSVEDADPAAAAAIRSRLPRGHSAEAESPGDHLAPHAPFRADVVLVAVPPAVTSSTVLRAQKIDLNATVTDAASVKARPLAEISTSGGDLNRYVPGHPIAGSERSGPAAARPDLFVGRTWVLTPTVDSDRVAQVVRLVRDLGATPVLATAHDHDAALAVTSHLPQVVASALAAVVETRNTAGGHALDLADVVGPALLEMTRVANSSPELWAQIAEANAEPVADAVEQLAGVLQSYVDGVRGSEGASHATRALVTAGARGRRRIADKHGRAARPAGAPRLGGGDGREQWSWVDVVVPDEPGALARLFARADALGVNIEDLHVDHAPHSPTGVVTLAVRAADAERLRAALR